MIPYTVVGYYKQGRAEYVEWVEAYSWQEARDSVLPDGNVIVISVFEGHLVDLTATE